MDINANSAIVVAKDGDTLILKIRRHSACEKCGVCFAWGGGANDSGETVEDGADDNPKKNLIKAQNLCDADIGDIVELEVQTSGFLKAAALMYAVPCVLFLAGLSVGAAFFTDTAGLAAGAGFVAVWYLFIKIKKRVFETDEYTPKAVRIL